MFFFQQVIAFPGENSADEFKLIEVLADELLWWLQKSESTRNGCEPDNVFLQDVCRIILRSVQIHPYALSVMAHNSALRSGLFRALRKAVIVQRNDPSVDADRIVVDLAKIATSILSLLSVDVEMVQSLETNSSKPEWRMRKIQKFIQWNSTVEIIFSHQIYSHFSFKIFMERKNDSLMAIFNINLVKRCLLIAWFFQISSAVQSSVRWIQF